MYWIANNSVHNYTFSLILKNEEKQQQTNKTSCEIKSISYRLNLQVVSANFRVASSKAQVRSLKARVAKLKERCETRSTSLGNKTTS